MCKNKISYVIKNPFILVFAIIMSKLELSVKYLILVQDLVEEVEAMAQMSLGELRKTLN